MTWLTAIAVFVIGYWLQARAWEEGYRTAKMYSCDHRYCIIDGDAICKRCGDLKENH